MNTGIVMIGLALVLLSVALIVSPSDAAGQDTACSHGSGSPVFMPDHSPGQGGQSAVADRGAACIPGTTVYGSGSSPRCPVPCPVRYPPACHAPYER